MNDSCAVEVQDLTKRFGDFTAVDRVTFEVEPGEIFGFLGPNGAGKTTTIRMLTGLLQATSGDSCVAGLDVKTQTDAVKQHIGYMSQLFSLYGDLTVDENIEPLNDCSRCCCSPVVLRTPCCARRRRTRSRARRS